MGIKTYNPYTPSRRQMTGLDFQEITKTTPEKSLKELKKEELKKIDGGSSVSYPKNYSFSCKKMLDNSYNIML